MSNLLEGIAREEANKNSNEIFTIEYENKKYWVKKARPTTSSKLHKFFYRLFPFEVLVPSEDKSGKETIEYETSKLKQFRNLGINTPNVIFKCNDFFILEDCGISIHSIIRDKNISEEKLYYYIEKVLAELSKIHNNSLFHGGAQTRNFTYQNGNIYAIDLEESFNNDINVKTLQFRDLLFLLLSFIKIKASFELDYNLIIKKYLLLTNNVDTVERLKGLANKISFLIYISEISFVKKFLGSDVKAFFSLFKILKNL